MWKKLLIFVLGVSLGGLMVFLYFYNKGEFHGLSDEESAILTSLLAIANEAVPQENFSCEIPSRLLASVIVTRGFLSVNSSKLFRSAASFGCDGDACTLSVNYCSDEFFKIQCGGTYIRFKIDARKKIDPTTLTCIDVL